MIAQYIPALLAALLAYGSSPQNIKDGIKSQLTVKNIAQKAAVITATGAACLIAHEYGHALTAQALDVPVDYVCVGNAAWACTPENAWLSIGNFHIAGLSMAGGTLMDIAKLSALSAADQIKICIAGPLAGLLAHFGIKYATHGKWHNPINATANAVNLLPMLSLEPLTVTDGAKIALNIPGIDTLFINNCLVVSACSGLLTLCTQLYSLWPRGEAYKTEAKSSRMRRLLQSVKRFGQKFSLASANLIFYSLAIPMRLDAIDGGKPKHQFPLLQQHAKAQQSHSPLTTKQFLANNQLPKTLSVRLKELEASTNRQNSDINQLIIPVVTDAAAPSKPSQVETHALDVPAAVKTSPVAQTDNRPALPLPSEARHKISKPVICRPDQCFDTTTPCPSGNPLPS